MSYDVQCPAALNRGGSSDKLDLGLVGSSIKIQPYDASGGGGAHTTPQKDDGPASPAPLLSAAPSSRSMLKKDEAHAAATPPRLDHSDEGLMVRVS